MKTRTLAGLLAGFVLIAASNVTAADAKTTASPALKADKAETSATQSFKKFEAKKFEAKKFEAKKADAKPAEKK